MCFMFLTLPASFPCQYDMGPKVNVKEVEHSWKGRSTVWPENLAGIKFGGLALKGCELHLAN